MLIIKEQSVLNPVMKKNHCRPVKYDWSAMIFLKLKLKGEMMIDDFEAVMMKMEEIHSQWP